MNRRFFGLTGRSHVEADVIRLGIDRREYNAWPKGGPGPVDTADRRGALLVDLTRVGDGATYRSGRPYCATGELKTGC